jgi:cytochrome c1
MRISGPLIPVIAALLHSGCGAPARQSAGAITGGDPGRGASAILRYGCGACHTIPGISGAHALVGPDLSRIASRTYLAGSLENRPENMIRWLRNPPAIDSRTAMPMLGVSERDATDIAAYLYTLK